MKCNKKRISSSHASSTAVAAVTAASFFASAIPLQLVMLPACKRMNKQKHLYDREMLQQQHVICLRAFCLLCDNKSKMQKKRRKDLEK